MASASKKLKLNPERALKVRSELRKVEFKPETVAPKCVAEWIDLIPSTSDSPILMYSVLLPTIAALLGN